MRFCLSHLGGREGGGDGEGGGALVRRRRRGRRLGRLGEDWVKGAKVGDDRYPVLLGLAGALAAADAQAAVQSSQSDVDT